VYIIGERPELSNQKQISDANPQKENHSDCDIKLGDDVEQD
jgi:hypothetical protein